MAMRAAAAKIQVCLMESSRKMMTTMISRYFSSDGRVFSEEEKAAENIYIKKMERERIEKAKKKLEKEKPAAYKYKSDKKLLHRAPKALNRWEMCGQVKVVLKSESEDDLLVLQERAKSLNLPTHITIDAGRTQIAPNSRTVMALLGEWFTFPIQMTLIS
ncbi:hypothetical protein IFM89_014680 [Coptis chinensis]|uniref:peptidyl-tRNA hydrolase n=1 Tax=Coptis chinensis TaxID=261450 RepID=A0A835HK58_9MAGN|nr:hypothetical protein IFM89_014680 [Coptis chinensis]